MSALSYKAKENKIVVVEDLKLEAPKTRQFADVLKGWDLQDKKVLFVMQEDSDNLYLSLRNLPSVEGTLLADINTYDIIHAEVLVLSETVAKVFAAEAAEEVKE